MYVGYLKSFYNLHQNLHFYILWQVNLFYDMQSKFQNESALPKKTSEVHFITSLNIFSVALLQLKFSLIWTRVCSQLARFSEVLLYLYLKHKTDQVHFKQINTTLTFRWIYVRVCESHEQEIPDCFEYFTPYVWTVKYVNKSDFQSEQ
jgi:hypothetical protein